MFDLIVKYKATFPKDNSPMTIISPIIKKMVDFFIDSTEDTTA